MMPELHGDWIDLHEDHAWNTLSAEDPVSIGSLTSSPYGDIHSQIDPEAYAWQRALTLRNAEIVRRESKLRLPHTQL